MSLSPNSVPMHVLGELINFSPLRIFENSHSSLILLISRYYPYLITETWIESVPTNVGEYHLTFCNKVSTKTNESHRFHQLLTLLLRSALLLPLQILTVTEITIRLLDQSSEESSEEF